MSSPLAASRPVAGETARPPAHPGSALAAAALGFFAITLDALVVNVALPSIRRDLGGGIPGLQWVLDGYTLMFAALLLSAGSLSDRLGSRRAFGPGMAVFIAPRPPAAWPRTWACWSRRASSRAPAPRS